MQSTFFVAIKGGLLCSFWGEETWELEQLRNCRPPLWWSFWQSFWRSSWWILWRQPLVELLVEFTLGGTCVHGGNPYSIFLLLSTLTLLLPSLLYLHITGTPLCPMYMPLLVTQSWQIDLTYSLSISMIVHLCTFLVLLPLSKAFATFIIQLFLSFCKIA